MTTRPGAAPNPVTLISFQKRTISPNIAAEKPGKLLPVLLLASLLVGVSSAVANPLSADELREIESLEMPLFGLVPSKLSAINPSPTNFSPPIEPLELKMTGFKEAVVLPPVLEQGDLWAEIRKGFSIPELDNSTVRTHERILLRNRKQLTLLLKRSEPYIYFIAQECARRGMPLELALLPFMESQFNPHARSHAAAVGLWQFIPSTGRQYRLKQNEWLDERRDPVASTRAALDYLSYLHRLHGDWHLALASYNWGEGSVLRAMKKAQASGLKPQFENLRLPAETRHYIPKLQALKNIIENPADFDVVLPPFPNKPYFTKIRHNTDVDLREIAKIAGVELEVIRRLNPGVNQPVLYAAHSNTLLVPVKYAEKVKARLTLSSQSPGL